MRPITASDLMNPAVLVVGDDLSLRDLAAFLAENEITGAPVENGSGELVGVVSMVDVARAVAAGETAKRVADVMTPEVYHVTEDATVSEIASLMIDHHLHRLLVTRDDEPVGIISTSDLLGLLIDDD
ncbi:MAG TPA: CBS domain-containing protein [Thermoanaerobaculia bacterium]|jgi:CBS domain-containing protein